MKFLCRFIFIFFIAASYAQHPNNCQSVKKQSMASIPTLLMTAPENQRSDTADILSYEVNLDITDFATDTIRGFAKVKFVPKINGLNYLCLDLLKMKIDSVTMNQVPTGFYYNDTLLNIDLVSALLVTDTAELSVFYHGKPVMDVSGWGGWYRQSGYAYNLGVGFDANPHVYGRVWHPCFDNFAERAKYIFHITTNGGKLAYCNGQLTGDTTDANGFRTRTWKLNEEIPSYLASITVAAYAQVNQSYNTLSGSAIPVTLVALPADTTNLKNSFLHLNNALAGFENWYGPYVWNRVGYCLVPFNSGAMEHATNITYPRSAANGTLNYEADLMAHELSHHWWGDHSTCETAGDMWLNEGLASYSEYLFRDWVYGWNSYIEAIKQNHEDMVHFAHLREGQLAISGVPHQYTYGDHVYRKGADVAHTLRSYLGDSLFSVGMKYVQQQKAFKNINSVEFGNLLTAATGKNINQFITDWVLNPGWPHFSIDSFSVVSVGGGQWAVTAHIRQKLFGAPFYYSNVPLEITFKNQIWQSETRSVSVSGGITNATFLLPFQPTFAGINLESKISDAISSRHKIIKSTGSVSFAPANLSLNVISAGVDSSWVRVEHNFVAPDSIKNNFSSYRINTQHYWKVDGIFSPTFHSKATFWYDGRKTTSGATQYLDTCLTINTADSLILLFRKNTADDWREVDKYTKTKLGGPNGKYGYFTVDTLRSGEYASANGLSAVLPGFAEHKKQTLEFSVYPNPAQDLLTIELKNATSGIYTYCFTDIQGRIVKEGKFSENKITISVSGFASGVHSIRLSTSKGISAEKKFIHSR
jgi:Peptidase family M1 domain/Secretion system C-terminal sorting domain/Peptidase M1 N-terminal domain